MSVLADLNHAALSEAIEANGAKFLLDLGRAGGGEERHDDLDWVIGGSPIDYHNAIYGARLTKADADAGVAVSLCAQASQRPRRLACGAIYATARS